MTRDDAERERDRLAAERPDSTWIVHETGAGEWEVVRIGMPSSRHAGSHAESKPRPPDADDPRPAHFRNVGGPWVGGA